MASAPKHVSQAAGRRDEKISGVIRSRKAFTSTLGTTAKSEERFFAESFVGERRWLRMARPKYAPVTRWLRDLSVSRAWIVAAFIIPPRSTQEAHTVDLMAQRAVRWVRAAVRVRATLSWSRVIPR